jgi:hypothetical protein
VTNPAFVKFKGKYYLYYKSNGARYGVAVSEKLEGPYVHHKRHITRTNKIIEDGTAFVWDGRVCLITTDNKGTLVRGGGLLWESEDGVSFGAPSRAYYTLEKYISKEQYPHTHQVKGRIGKGDRWKVVRPQILMEDGRPAWLYGPTAAYYKDRKYTNCLVFRILTDEEVLKKREEEKSEDER